MSDGFEKLMREMRALDVTPDPEAKKTGQLPSRGKKI